MKTNTIPAEIPCGCWVKDPANIPAIPADLLSRNQPSVAKWAQDKIQSYGVEHYEASDDCPAFYARSWYFEGRMPRLTKQSFDVWEGCNGAQYRIGVAVRGGHYKGERQSVNICFTEYRSMDGSPLPTE